MSQTANANARHRLTAVWTVKGDAGLQLGAYYRTMGNRSRPRRAQLSVGLTTPALIRRAESVAEVDRLMAREQASRYTYWHHAALAGAANYRIESLCGHAPDEEDWPYVIVPAGTRRT